ncbi:GroES family chaperonin [Alteromonas sp. RKMC-009]|uniref:GroES family chaperonin n=1 Tax=Alteromonas sp. RKMC-009 TaxID=2267264 RepID=UPI001375C3CE|nr:co-chaperone GroES [Alteromonas sp. RKMC-009]
MCQTLKPLEDRIIISDDARENDSIIEVTDKRPSNIATVLAVGPGRVLKNGRRAPVGVSVGDKIFISCYAGYRYELDSGTVRIIHEADVQAVL